MRALVLVTLLLSACSNRGAPIQPGDGAVDGGATDAPPADVLAADSGALDAVDAGPQSCSDLLTARAFDLAPGFLETQIHPQAAFDGEQLWATFTAHRVGVSDLDVFLTRLSCDGTSLGLADGQPVSLSENINPNETDSSVAIHGERVLTAWGSGGEGSVQTFVRAFDRTTGAPLSAESIALTEREEEPVTATTWFPQLAPSPAGFYLAGTRGVEAARGFQVFLQSVSLDGVLEGTASEPFFALESTHTDPEMAVGPDGAHLVWTHNPNEGGSLAYYAAPGSEAQPVDDTIVVSRAPSVAVDPVSGAAVVAYTPGESGVRMKVMVEGAEPVVVNPGALVPYVALGPNGGALLFAGGVRGISARELSVIPFAVSGSTIILGAGVAVPVRGVVPVLYRPSIIHLQDDFFLVVWSEGANPAFVAKGAIMELPAP